MGNTNSNGSRPNHSPSSRSASAHPPNSGLRTKKKSLELPDLALLSITTTPYSNASGYRGRSPRNPPKSASIPIPNAESSNARQRPGTFEESSTHIPLPPPTQQPYFKGAPQNQNQNQNQAPSRTTTPPVTAKQYQGGGRSSKVPNYNTITSTLSAIAHPNPPPPSRNPSPSHRKSDADPKDSDYPQVVVRSSIPQPTRKESLEVKPVMVKITWNGGGKNVLLARAGDDDWKGRSQMIRESPTSDTHTITIPLLPGTHHLRFLVDDQWRVAQDLLTAVDDQGSLANYVAVGLDGGVSGGGEGVPVASSPGEGHTHPIKMQINLNGISSSSGSATATAASTPKAPRPPIHTGHSFWSADSSNGDGEDHRGGAPNQHEDHDGVAAASSSSPPHASGSGGGKRPAAKWTTEIPLELVEAAVEEDVYLAAQQQQQQQLQEQQARDRDRDGHGRGKDRGRGRSGHTHNGASQQTQVISGFIPLPQIPPAPGLPRHLEKLILNMRSYPGNPTGSAANTPGGVPGPGGSVIGAGQGGQGVRSGGREERRPVRGTRRDRRVAEKVPPVPSSPPPTSTSTPATPTADDTTTPTAGTSTADNSTASNSADASTEASPTISSLPGPQQLANGSGGSLPPSISLQPGTPVSTTPAFPTSVSTPNASHAPQSTSQSTLNGINGLNSTPLADDTVIADDTSVLPVPSHVVLHHLSTSAIRNGVLAVGGTVRYKKKYMTTVYYKPT